MHILHNIYQGASDYYDEIPKNTLHQMVYAFGGAFLVRCILRNDPKAAAIAGALSALATAVHGLVTPLFKYFVAGRTQLTWGEEMGRTFIAIGTAGYIGAALGERSIIQNLSFHGAIYGLATYFVPSRCDLNSTDDVILFPAYIAQPVI